MGIQSQKQSGLTVNEWCEGMAPAKVFEIRDICHVYACKTCNKEAEPVTVRKATFPAAVIPVSVKPIGV